MLGASICRVWESCDESLCFGTVDEPRDPGWVGEELSADVHSAQAVIVSFGQPHEQIGDRGFESEGLCCSGVDGRVHREMRMEERCGRCEAFIGERVWVL